MASRWLRVRLGLGVFNRTRGWEFLLMERKGETILPVEFLMAEMVKEVELEIWSEEGVQVELGLNLLLKSLGLKCLEELEKWSFMANVRVILFIAVLTDSSGIKRGVGIKVRPLSKISI